MKIALTIGLVLAGGFGFVAYRLLIVLPRRMREAVADGWTSDGYVAWWVVRR